MQDNHANGGHRVVKVAKFGGSSVASASQIAKVCNIVKRDPLIRVVVVSAPGKRSSNDAKVTDMLLAAGNAKLKGESIEPHLKALVERFASIQREAGVDAAITAEIEKDLRQRLESNHSNAHSYTDLLKAAGEDLNAKLCTAIFNKNGLNAVYMSPRDAGLLLSSDHGNAMVLDESYPKIKQALSAVMMERVVVFPGFFGHTVTGEVVTFPRGGSDITGAVLAAAVKADEYENFTDVDSVFAADPRIVHNPKSIPELTYREMRELSYAGFSG